MNTAILTTMALVLVFLAINGGILFKLTVELQKANAKMRQLQDSVEQAEATVVALQDLVHGKLSEPVKDLASKAVDKIKGVFNR